MNRSRKKEKLLKEHKFWNCAKTATNLFKYFTKNKRLNLYWITYDFKKRNISKFYRKMNILFKIKPFNDKDYIYPFNTHLSKNLENDAILSIAISHNKYPDEKGGITRQNFDKYNRDIFLIFNSNFNTNIFNNDTDRDIANYLSALSLKNYINTESRFFFFNIRLIDKGEKKWFFHHSFFLIFNPQQDGDRNAIIVQSWQNSTCPYVSDSFSFDEFIIHLGNLTFF